MNKLKIERGASKLRWVLLKTNIEESIAADIDLMCKWSDNDRKYIVNELLRFALGQSEEFRKYKSELETDSSGAADDEDRVDEDLEIASDTTPSSNPTPVFHTSRQ
jgi:hypothetical protein